MRGTLAVLQRAMYFGYRLNDSNLSELTIDIESSLIRMPNQLSNISNIDQ